MNELVPNSSMLYLIYLHTVTVISFKPKLAVVFLVILTSYFLKNKMLFNNFILINMTTHN